MESTEPPCRGQLTGVCVCVCDGGWGWRGERMGGGVKGEGGVRGGGGRGGVEREGRLLNGQ